MRRIRSFIVLVAATGALSACADEDLAAFNAGMEMYNGVTYYDVTDPNETLQCAVYDGYLTLHSGVRNNQQYVYVTSRTDRDVQFTIKDQAGGGSAFIVPARGTSETYWTYPTYSLEWTWTC